MSEEKWLVVAAAAVVLSMMISGWMCRNFITLW